MIYAPLLQSSVFFSVFLTPPARSVFLTNVIPSHYSLEFTPDLKAATFSGYEVIDVNIKEPTNAITLNAIELKFESVGIDVPARRASKRDR